MYRGSSSLLLFALFSIVFQHDRSIAAGRFPPTPDEMRRNRFSRIIRMDLEDDTGQSAGKVKDFILNRRSGTVMFGIVTSGGTLGLGRSHKIVPAGTLNANTAKTGAIGFSVSRFKLAEAFDFKRRDLASLQQPGRARELDVIFGLARATQSPSTNHGLQPTGSRATRNPKTSREDRLELASELLGLTVATRNQKIGKISDLLIDPSGHRETIALVASSHALKHRKTYAIPLRRLESTTNNQLSLDAELIAFSTAPRFDLRAWENGSSSETVCWYDDVEPDNTARNFNPENVAQTTPLNQSESMPDLRLTQQIRQEIARAPGLSFTARNVKVVTMSGKVTLKGPVMTPGEKERILNIARKVAGKAGVTDQLEVKQ
jgi:hyperosmotically inducible protein